MSSKKITNTDCMNLWNDIFEKTAMVYFKKPLGSVKASLYPYDSKEDIFRTMLDNHTLTTLSTNENTNIPLSKFKKDFFDIFREVFIAEYGLDKLLNVMSLNLKNQEFYGKDNAMYMIKNNLHESLMELPVVSSDKYIVDLFMTAIRSDIKSKVIFDSPLVLLSFKDDSRLMPVLTEILFNSALANSPHKRIAYSKELNEKISVEKFLAKDISDISKNTLFQTVKTFTVSTSSIALVSLNGDSIITKKFKEIVSGVFNHLNGAFPDKLFTSHISDNGKIQMSVEQSFCKEDEFIGAFTIFIQNMNQKKFDDNTNGAKSFGNNFMEILQALQLNNVLDEKLKITPSTDGNTNKENDSPVSFKL